MDATSYARFPRPHHHQPSPGLYSASQHASEASAAPSSHMSNAAMHQAGHPRGGSYHGQQPYYSYAMTAAAGGTQGGGGGYYTLSGGDGLSMQVTNAGQKGQSSPRITPASVQVKRESISHQSPQMATGTTTPPSSAHGQASSGMPGTPQLPPSRRMSMQQGNGGGSPAPDRRGSIPAQPSTPQQPPPPQPQSPLQNSAHQQSPDTVGTEETPLYVNAKQFHRILKRRVARQRLEEALRLTSKQRKPYLHESRHNHAMRRPRGPGGRFLTADEVAEMERRRREQDNGLDQPASPSPKEPSNGKLLYNAVPQHPSASRSKKSPGRRLKRKATQGELSSSPKRVRGGDDLQESLVANGSDQENDLGAVFDDED